MLLRQQLNAIVVTGWNQPSFADNTCSNGNICEVFQDGTTICKSPLYGLCFDISDCSSTLAGPDLECNKEGGSDSGYCAVIPRGGESGIQHLHSSSHTI
jgi:hypothetical protein